MDSRGRKKRLDYSVLNNGTSSICYIDAAVKIFFPKPQVNLIATKMMMKITLGNGIHLS